MSEIAHDLKHLLDIIGQRRTWREFGQAKFLCTSGGDWPFYSEREVASQRNTEVRGKIILISVNSP
ncbi:MAG: hypothetical protein WCD73_19800, partial [Pseudolabrys sp.]